MTKFNETPKRLGGNDTMEVFQRSTSSRIHTEEYGENLILPDIRAKFMMDILSKWGMAHGHYEGEDSAGRARMVLTPVADVIERAAEMTALAFAEMDRRGWLVKLDRPADLPE